MAATTMAGRRALVTGASSGLGAHFAQVLAQAGAEVVACGRRPEALEATCAAIRAAGGTAEAMVLDVADARAVQRLEEMAIDIVVNNAGIAATAPALDTAPEAFAAIVDTNLNGAFAVARAAARGMVARGTGGAIVNVASILGLRVAAQVAAYAASKAALIQLTRALALEWARYGVRVNALCPGYIDTPLNRDFIATDAGQALIRRIPQRRLGRLQDLDGPLLLLASDAGAYMTGTALCVDGGHLVSGL